MRLTRFCDPLSLYLCMYIRSQCADTILSLFIVAFQCEDACDTGLPYNDCAKGCGVSSALGSRPLTLALRCLFKPFSFSPFLCLYDLFGYFCLLGHFWLSYPRPLHPLSRPAQSHFSLTAANSLAKMSYYATIQ